MSDVVPTSYVFYSLQPEQSGRQCRIMWNVRLEFEVLLPFGSADCESTPRESIRCECTNTLTIAGGTQYAQEQYTTESIRGEHAKSTVYPVRPRE
jgi:hypothetical protein